jgi:hypothetical protein
MEGDNTIVLSILEDDFKATQIQNDVELTVGNNRITIKDFDKTSSYSIIFLDGNIINLSEAVFL